MDNTAPVEFVEIYKLGRESGEKFSNKICELYLLRDLLDSYASDSIIAVSLDYTLDQAKDLRNIYSSDDIKERIKALLDEALVDFQKDILTALLFNESEISFFDFDDLDEKIKLIQDFYFCGFNEFIEQDYQKKVEDNIKRLNQSKIITNEEISEYLNIPVEDIDIMRNFIKNN